MNQFSREIHVRGLQFSERLKEIFIYIIKQDIRIYVSNSQPNGWTDRVEFFCGHSGVLRGGVLG